MTPTVIPFKVCHKRFALASVRKAKCLRRKQTLEVVKEMTYGGILARVLEKGCVHISAH